MKRKPVKDETFTMGDNIIVIDKNSEYFDKVGTIERLGSAGEDVIYIHARIANMITIMTFRTFQVQKGS